MNQENVNPLFYFSGTGGCLATARNIAIALPEYKPIPIASVRSGYTVSADAVGFVFPLYFSGLPQIVTEFINRLTFTKPCYIFAVVTCGRPVTGYALKQLDRLLKRNEQRLSAGFYLKMTDNYLPLYHMPGKEKLEKRDRDYEVKSQKIISHIQCRDQIVAPSLGWVLFASTYPRFIQTLSEKDIFFSVDECCNSCGLCQKVCPVSNITMTDTKPNWQHHCEFCLACIHFCPQQAIQWKNITQKKGRYHFKGITATDISQQKQSSR